ncbi:MAG TPA: hypothetical protein VND21_08945 [Planctomycetota bacterium]|nr:hypothetical protein [Planctomycetota bacterium]
MLLDALLRLVLLPGVLVAAAAGLGRLFFPRAEAAREALLGAGLATGFALALASIGVRPDLPLATSDPAWSWVAWFAAAGALLGAAEILSPRSRGVALTVRALLGAAAAWLILTPLVPHAMASGVRIAGVVGGALLVAGLWTVLLDASRRGGRAALAGPVLISLFATSVVLLLYGRSAVMAQAPGALLSGVGVAVALRLRSPGALLPMTVAPVVSLVLVGLCVGGWGYLNHASSTRFPIETGVLLVASAAAPVLRKTSLALSAAVLLSAAAAGLAWLREVPAPTPW